MTGARYRSMIERLLANSVLDEESGCWVWLGSKSGQYGKLTVRVAGRRLPIRLWAHRVAYSVFRLDGEPIPKGLHVDHLCRYTWCVNPMHLELVTVQENNRRRDEQALFRP